MWMCIGTDELFDQTHELGQQELLATLPALLHLVVHVACGLEDDPLRAELPRQALQFNGRDLCYVRLAIDSWSQLGDLHCLGGIEMQGLHRDPNQGAGVAGTRGLYG